MHPSQRMQTFVRRRGNQHRSNPGNQKLHPTIRMSTFEIHRDDYSLLSPRKRTSNRGTYAEPFAEPLRRRMRGAVVDQNNRWHGHTVERVSLDSSFRIRRQSQNYHPLCRFRYQQKVCDNSSSLRGQRSSSFCGKTVSSYIKKPKPR